MKSVLIKASNDIKKYPIDTPEKAIASLGAVTIHGTKLEQVLLRNKVRITYPKLKIKT
jgi:hypothetical protein